MNPPSGIHTPKIFALNKPPGVSSAHYLGAFKRHLGKRYSKIGHFGTLDPFACGVLLVGVGGAMRLMDLVHQELPKTYLAVGKLGIESTTGDREGEKKICHTPLEINQNITREMFEKKIQESFQGSYLQAPHVFSASKFAGKNLYEWAREGVMIEKPKVLRHLYKVEVVKWALPYVSLRVEVSTGTYVRTLFEDLATGLGTKGYLVALAREKIGAVEMQQCMQKKNWAPDMPEVSLLKLLPQLPQIKLDEISVRHLQQGKIVVNAQVEEFLVSKKVWILDLKDQIVGVAIAHQGNLTSYINFIC